MKRVAAATGEGASAIPLIHAYLEERRATKVSSWPRRNDLAARGPEVVAVERDPDMFAVLQRRLPQIETYCCGAELIRAGRLRKDRVYRATIRLLAPMIESLRR